jgi:SNF2 family DNA or RNA helicase
VIFQIWFGLNKNFFSVRNYISDPTKFDDILPTPEEVNQTLGKDSANYRTLASLRVKLLDHQKTGVTWMMKQEADREKRGGILADDMGLGKVRYL